MPHGQSSVVPRLLPTVVSTAHHQRSVAFGGPSSAVPLPLSVMPPTLPTEYHGYVNTLCRPSPEKPRPPRLTYSFEHLNSYRDSVVSKQCNREVRKRLFKLHLWTSNRESLHKNCSRRFDKSSISLQHSRNYVSFSLINARSVCNKITYLRDYIDSRDLDIIGFVETWLVKDNTADVTLLTKPGYDMVHFPRPDRRGGGVEIMYKSTFSHISTKQITSH